MVANRKLGLDIEGADNYISNYLRSVVAYSVAVSLWKESGNWLA